MKFTLRNIPPDLDRTDYEVIYTIAKQIGLSDSIADSRNIDVPTENILYAAALKYLLALTRGETPDLKALISKFTTAMKFNHFVDALTARLLLNLAVIILNPRSASFDLQTKIQWLNVVLEYVQKLGHLKFLHGDALTKLKLLTGGTYLKIDQQEDLTIAEMNWQIAEAVPVLALPIACLMLQVGSYKMISYFIPHLLAKAEADTEWTAKAFNQAADSAPAILESIPGIRLSDVTQHPILPAFANLPTELVPALLMQTDGEMKLLMERKLNITDWLTKDLASYTLGDLLPNLFRQRFAVRQPLYKPPLMEASRLGIENTAVPTFRVLASLWQIADITEADIDLSTPVEIAGMKKEAYALFVRKFFYDWMIKGDHQIPKFKYLNELLKQHPQLRINYTYAMEFLPHSKGLITTWSHSLNVRKSEVYKQSLEWRVVFNLLETGILDPSYVPEMNYQLAAFLPLGDDSFAPQSISQSVVALDCLESELLLLEHIVKLAQSIRKKKGLNALKKGFDYEAIRSQWQTRWGEYLQKLVAAKLTQIMQNAQIDNQTLLKVNSLISDKDGIFQFGTDAQNNQKSKETNSAWVSLINEIKQGVHIPLKPLVHNEEFIQFEQDLVALVTMMKRIADIFAYYQTRLGRWNPSISRSNTPGDIPTKVNILSEIRSLGGDPNTYAFGWTHMTGNEL